MDFFESIATGNWVTRDNCGEWPHWVRTYYIGSHMSVMGLYLSYPIMIFLLLKKFLGTSVAFHFDSKTRFFKAVLTHALFVLCCGIGHLLEGVVMFYWPNYFAVATWHYITAAVSTASVVFILKMLDDAIRSVVKDDDSFPVQRP